VAQGKSWSLKTSTTITDTGEATHTIGGSRRIKAIRIQTNTATYTDSGKDLVSLQTLDKSRAVNFDELETRSGPEDQV
jgi:hypothetical protein